MRDGIAPRVDGMISIGVLCTRVRKEEKAMIEAMSGLGLTATLVSPVVEPISVGPVGARANGNPGHAFGVHIDRCKNRSAGAAIIAMHRAHGSLIIDAGFAATANRLHIAQELAAAEVPRPLTLLALSEAAGLTALESTGFPATLFPLQPGTSGIDLLDRDVAEAVLEHRDVLGASGDAVTLVQRGAFPDESLAKAIVVNGEVIAFRSAAGADASGVRFIAEQTATTLGASLVGITFAREDFGWVVWDIDPVPDFRDFVREEASAVASAIGRLAASLSAEIDGTEFVQRTTATAAQIESERVVLSA